MPECWCCTLRAGVGHLFEAFLGIPAAGVNLVIVMAYTAVGGFLSVVRTDVLQGALMLVGSVLPFAFVTHAMGWLDCRWPPALLRSPM